LFRREAARRSAARVSEGDPIVDPLVGTLVADRYRVERKLAEGGMGLVYLATHEALRKRVALKILGAAARGQREAVARFEREAIAAGNLKHPNIAEATDFGQLPDGAMYLVMEYVEGTTLRQLLTEQRRLSPPRALRILEQIGGALDAAHAHGVVHRDLKPENVIVSGPNDRVKVIDFGIAKMKSETFGAPTKGVTAVGTVVGTAEYMAPEQVMAQAVDARADQYALGVLAFELVTGQPPFKTEDIGRVMMMHVGAPVPSTRDSVPTLPPEVDAVTSRMLAKLPDERYASVAEAMKALSSALTAKPSVPSAPVVPLIPIVPPPPRPAAMPAFDTTLRSPRRDPLPAPSPATSRRGVVIAIVAGAVLLVVGIVVAVAVFLLRFVDAGESKGKPKSKGKGKKN
jgi:eukaryotic-like serine/threonine-protein kinase